MRAFVVGVMLFIGFAVYAQDPAKNPTKAGEPAKAQATERKAEPPKVAATEQKAEPPKVPATEAKREPPKAEAVPSESWWKISLSDLLMVVFTGALVWATKRTMKATEKNARAAEASAKATAANAAAAMDSAVAAKDTAAATKALITATYQSEAPFLIPKVIKAPDVAGAGPAAVVRPSRYTFLNQGKTPGIIVKFNDVVRFLVGQHPADPETLFVDTWVNRRDVYIPIGPDHETASDQFICGIAAADQQAAINGIPQGRFLLVGRVLYVDLFGRFREQRFCLKFRDDGTYTRFGDAAYNYDRAVE